MIRWLIGWLFMCFHRLMGWLSGKLIDWLICRLSWIYLWFGLSIYRVVGRLVGRLVDCLMDSDGLFIWSMKKLNTVLVVAYFLEGSGEKWGWGDGSFRGRIHFRWRASWVQYFFQVVVFCVFFCVRRRVGQCFWSAFESSLESRSREQLLPSLKTLRYGAVHVMPVFVFSEE